MAPAPPPPPTTLTCPRCAAPLVTLGAGAALWQLSLQCTGCGHWVRLDRPGGGVPPGPPALPTVPMRHGAGTSAPVAGGWAGGWAGALEIVGLVGAVLGALSLGGLGFALSSLEGTLREVGGELPALTAFVLRVRLPWLLAVLVLGLAGAALVVRLRGGTAGRWLVGAALLVALVGAPLCIVAFYLSLFSMAGNIQ